MQEAVFTELSLIIAIAAAMALIMRLIRQPLIIGHILTGIIVGPSVLHLVQSPQTINIFADIGIALLLFIIGLGLNPRVIKEVGKVATLTGIVQVVISTIIGWLFGMILGLGKSEALFFGIALSFSSTIIILKLLSDKKELTRLYGKVLVGILLIQDILAIIALLFVNAKAGSGFSVTELSWLAAKSILIAVPFLIIGSVILPRLHKLIGGSQEFLFLFAIGWGFGLAALFARAGLSLEIGALLAGVALADLPFAQEISARLRPLRDFFIIVFFITLGTRLAFSNITLLLPLILVGSFAVIVLKPLVVLCIMGWLGYTKRSSFKAAVATAQVSEFSLVLIILANKQGVVSNDVTAVVTMIALISIAVSAYLIVYSDSLFARFDASLRLFERDKYRAEEDLHHHHDLVLFGYRKGGEEFLRVFKGLKKRYVVVDYDPEVIDQMEQQKVPFLYGDVTDVELLEELGLSTIKLIVSTITDFETSVFLIKHLNAHNSRAVVICHADTVQQADELYNLGASYVMMPHFIGSEKIGAFIRRSSLKKSEFKRYREKHLAYLHSHYEMPGEE